MKAIKILAAFAAAMTMAFTFTACGGDDDNEEDNSQQETKYEKGTLLEAFISFDYIDYFDVSFTLNDKPITMTREKKSDGVYFTYFVKEDHAGEAVKCTATLKSDADLSAIDINKNCTLSAGCSYLSVLVDETNTYSSHIRGASFSQTFTLKDYIDSGAATDKKGALEGVISSAVNFIADSVR